MVAATLDGCPTPVNVLQLRVVAQLQASPDDVTVDSLGNIWVTAREAGTITELSSAGAQLAVLHDHADPEGVVVLDAGRVIVAEQRLNRLVAIDVGGRPPQPLLAIPNTTSNPGLDGIGYDRAHDRLLIPDSANGRLLTAPTAGGSPKVVSVGLGRPVSAVATPGGDIYVAAETAPGLIRITRAGDQQTVGTFTNLDEVVFLNGLLYVAELGGHAVTAVDPTTGRSRTIVVGIDAPQGLATSDDAHLVVADSTGRRVFLAAACR